jgi:hypothetical protein
MSSIIKISFLEPHLGNAHCVQLSKAAYRKLARSSQNFCCLNLFCLKSKSQEKKCFFFYFTIEMVLKGANHIWTAGIIRIIQDGETNLRTALQFDTCTNRAPVRKAAVAGVALRRGTVAIPPTIPAHRTCHTGSRPRYAKTTRYRNKEDCECLVSICTA